MSTQSSNLTFITQNGACALEGAKIGINFNSGNIYGVGDMATINGYIPASVGMIKGTNDYIDHLIDALKERKVLPENWH